MPVSLPVVWPLGIMVTFDQNSADFVRSGVMYLYSGYLREVGYDGWYGTQTVLNSSTVFGVFFDVSKIYGTGTYARIYGFSARCLASGA